jgi:hypothetical protein
MTARTNKDKNEQQQILRFAKDDKAKAKDEARLLAGFIY